MSQLKPALSNPRPFCWFLNRSRYPLKARIKQFGVVEDGTCRFCEKEVKKPRHLLCDCEGEALARFRLQTFGKGFMTAEDYIETGDKKLMKFFTKIQCKKAVKIKFGLPP